MVLDTPSSFVRRPQLTVALALGLLLFVWTLRWQAAVPEILVINRLGTGSGSGSDAAASKALVPSGPTDPSNLDLPFDLSDPDAPFVGWPLRRACDETEWTPGVVFLCDNNFGGVGNIRNFILTCVRYAVEAGAAGMVMPRIHKRSDEDIKEIFGGHDYRPFSYLFDEAHFRQAMGEYCPQITLYDDISDVPHVRYKEELPNVETRGEDGKGKKKPTAVTTTTTVVPELDIEIISPRQWSREHFGEGEKCDFAELDHHTDRFGEWFRAWVTDPQGERPPASANNTRLFRGTNAPLGVLWEYPVYRDGPELANTFGGLCKFNPQVMRLGKQALAGMRAYARDEYLLRAAANNAGGGDKKRRRDAEAEDEVDEEAAMSEFLGMHLRSEADALDFWPTYEMQEQGYLGRVRQLADEGRRVPTVAYVASGNATETDKLRAAAAAAGAPLGGLKLVSKTDLLDAASVAELEALSWDQQGLVDYIVLTGAAFFMGNSRSSFTISVSLKRHLRGEGLYARPFHVRSRGGWQGNFLVGPLERYYDHWVFIWDAMWP